MREFLESVLKAYERWASMSWAWIASEGCLRYDMAAWMMRKRASASLL